MSTLAGETELQPAEAVTLDPAAEPEFDQRGVLTVTGAHFSHDLYSSFLGPLIPAVQDKLGVSLFIASLMVPAQQLPSICQPFIGVWADRTSKRWFVVLAPAVAAVATSMIGLAPSVAVILLLLLTSGLASAAFHTPAVALVGEYGGRQTGRAMSFFMAGGEFARTLGPLLITAVIAWLTLEGTVVTVVFGLAASIILYFTLDTSASDAAERARPRVAIRPLLRARRRFLIGLIGFTTAVNLYTAPFSFFLVKLLMDKGHSSWYAGFALSVFFAAGAVGGLLGGPLSDRFGRRAVLITTALLTPPLLYLFLAIEHLVIPGLIALALGSIIAMANRPIQLALGQDIMPEARGPMSGLMLAFGFVSMSAFAMSFSAVADRVGLETVFWLAPAMALLSIPFILLLPRPGERLPQAAAG